MEGENIEFNKEFWQLHDSKRTPGKLFEFASHQLFTSFYVNPYSDHKRVHNKSGTGLGKTLLALKCVKQFLDMGRPVYILGFQEARFIDELMHQPELGFVTHDEVAKLVSLERDLVHNNATVRKSYSEYRSRLKSRLKRINFYGYKLFAIRMFDMSYTNAQGKYIKRVNFDFIKSMRYSLIICDEIHDVYNTIEQNNWGTSIQLALNILGPDVHLLTMSATPILTSGEIREFMSLLIETPRMNIRKIQYGMDQEEQEKIVDSIIDFTHPDIKQYAIPKEINESIIVEQLSGKILYTPDIGIESLPMKHYAGIPIAGIDYLKFTVIPMSKWQNEATKANLHNHQLRHMGGFVPSYEASEPSTHVSKVSTFVEVFDNDEEEQIISKQNEQLLSHLGVGMKEQFKSEIETISANKYSSFRDTEGITIIRTQDGSYISGDVLKRENLIKYSPKYVEMLNIIEQSRTTRGGKILVYSYDVHNVGVLTIEQILKYNGIISTEDTPNEYTRCSKCFKFSKDHDDAHKFNPMRYMSIHSKTSANLIRNIMARFRAQDNRYGDDVTILIGSRKITVGTDIDCIRTEIVTSLPVSIPLLIQLFGRVARSHSHSKLEPDERNVHIYILVCAFADGSLDTPEITNYRDRMVDYLKIQKYNQIIDRVAVDAYVQETDKLIHANNEKLAISEGLAVTDTLKFLGPLSFNLPVKKLPTNVDQLDTVKYIAYKYNKYELATINVLITNAFADKKVWDIDALWKYIITSNGTPNPAEFDKHNYMLCLQTYPNISIKSNYVMNVRDIDVDGFSRIDNIRSYKKMKYSYVNILSELTKAIMALIAEHKKAQTTIQLINTYQIYESYNLTIHTKLLDEAIIDENKDILTYYATLFELLTNKFMRANIVGGELRVIGYRMYNTYKYLTADAKGVLTFKSTATSVPYVENSIIVGIYSDDMLFKLRQPIKSVSDMRKMPRGMVCNTMSRTDLIDLAKKLGLKYEKPQITLLCKQIKEELIARESKRLGNLKWIWLQRPGD